MITNEKYRNMFSIITIKLKEDWWCAQLKKYVCPKINTLIKSLLKY